MIYRTTFTLPSSDGAFILKIWGSYAQLEFGYYEQLTLLAEVTHASPKATTDEVIDLLITAMPDWASHMDAESQAEMKAELLDQKEYARTEQCA